LGKKYITFAVEESRQRGSPRKMGKEVMDEDMNHYSENLVMLWINVNKGI